MEPNIIFFIASIRNSFIGAEQVYTQGSCVAFFLILKAVYPRALPFWSADGKHMITQIDDEHYDINGLVNPETVRAGEYKYDAEEYLSMGVSIAIPSKKIGSRRFPHHMKLTKVDEQDRNANA